jgi:hypothetical protein
MYVARLRRPSVEASSVIWNYPEPPGATQRAGSTTTRPAVMSSGTNAYGVSEGSFAGISVPVPSAGATATELASAAEVIPPSVHGAPGSGV